MNYTCMVVEDEILIRNNIVKKIRNCNSRFEMLCEASNGKEALEFLKSQYVDLVITDVRMPIMDGLTLIRNITELYPSIKTLIISGYNEFSYAQEAIHNRVFDYLLKPIEIETLEETLNGIAASIDIDKTGAGKPCLQKQESDTVLSPVQRIQQYIYQNYTMDLTVNDLADEFHFTPSYLVKIFREQTGQTPLQYIIYLRINAAKELLVKNPQMNVSDVGLAVGYNDSAYFSRIFKKQTGIAPSAYGAHQES